MAAFLVLVFGAGRVGAAEQGPFGWRSEPFEAFCDNNCAMALYGGKFLHTEMVHIFAQGDLTPIWDWTLEGSTFFAGTFVRRIGSFGRFADIEAELGIGKRF
jgi:hypothetical protein